MISAATPGPGKRLDAITRFLPALGGPDAGGEWVGGGERDDGAYVMPRFAQSAVDDETIRTSDDDGWVRTLGQLLPLHVRKDRFVEGHVAGIFECGHIAAILLRLAVIREALR